MVKKQIADGFAIALAWPQTFCKQPDSWYDPLMRILGFNRNYFYKAGHAALVLVEKSTGDCHYFDFGRYHAPFGFGRSRSGLTDHELSMKTKAQIGENGQCILNYEDILEELANRPACHGDGQLHAGYCHVQFQLAWQSATDFQARSPLPYGPFVAGGTNCSRFVCSVILAGKPPLLAATKLQFFVPFTPSPMSNVYALTHKRRAYPKQEHSSPCPREKADKTWLKTTLPPPEKPFDLPEHAQWLSGEGAGSWFVLQLQKETFHVTRFDADGKMECEGYFIEKESAVFESQLPYRFTHLSHCHQLSIEQAGRTIVLKRVEAK